MRIAFALSAVLVAVGLACGGGGALSPAEFGASSGLTIAGRLPDHSWRVVVDVAGGCTGALRVITGKPEQSLWGCAPEDRTANPWPLFAGSATLATNGQSVILEDNDLNQEHGYPVPRNAALLAPDGTLTGTFSDANHFTGTITGWGAPIAITLELADRQ